MLNPQRLNMEIKQAFEEVLPPAFEVAVKQMLPATTTNGDETAKKFAETIKELICEDLAERISGAIDYYVKNANVYGTIITVGGPFSQTATVATPTPLLGGSVPNMLGIK